MKFVFIALSVFLVPEIGITQDSLLLSLMGQKLYWDQQLSDDIINRNADTSEIVSFNNRFSPIFVMGKLNISEAQKAKGISQIYFNTDSLNKLVALLFTIDSSDIAVSTLRRILGNPTRKVSLSNSDLSHSTILWQRRNYSVIYLQNTNGNCIIIFNGRKDSFFRYPERM